MTTYRSLAGAACLPESYWFICSLLTFFKIPLAAANLSWSTVTDQDEVGYFTLKRFLRTGMDLFFILLIFDVLCISFNLEVFHYYSIYEMKISLLSTFFPTYFSHCPPLKAVLAHHAIPFNLFFQKNPTPVFLPLGLYPFWLVQSQLNSLPVAIHFEWFSQTQAGVLGVFFLLSMLPRHSTFLALCSFKPVYFHWPLSLLCLIDCIFPF